MAQNNDFSYDPYEGLDDSFYDDPYNLGGGGGGFTYEDLFGNPVDEWGNPIGDPTMPGSGVVFTGTGFGTGEDPTSGGGTSGGGRGPTYAPVIPTTTGPTYTPTIPITNPTKIGMDPITPTNPTRTGGGDPVTPTKPLQPGQTAPAQPSQTTNVTKNTSIGLPSNNYAASVAPVPAFQYKGISLNTPQAQPLDTMAPATPKAEAPLPTATIPQQKGGSPTVKFGAPTAGQGDTGAYSQSKFGQSGVGKVLGGVAGAFGVNLNKPIPPYYQGIYDQIRKKQEAQ